MPADLVKRNCDIVIELPGPHPGCAEFAPPDLMRCNEPAVATLTIQDTYPEPWVSYLRVCAHHEAEVTEYDDGCSVIAERRELK